MFRNSTKHYSKNVAMGVKRGGKWIEWNYEEYFAAIRNTAKGFLACGLGRQTAVGIMGHNSPEWFMSSVGAVFAGGLSCGTIHARTLPLLIFTILLVFALLGVYTTSSGETVSYISDHAPFNVLVVQDSELLHKIREGRSTKEAFPTVKRLVLMETEGNHDSEGGLVMSWEELQEAGRTFVGGDEALNKIEEEQFVNDAAILIYTSGTTGPPKG
jgi:long-subunit acyl-CoA synthetase (AMP-forming)